MKTTVSKWGNSLGLRIPSAFAKELDLEDGAFVEMELLGNRLIISTQNQDLNKLKELTKDIDIGKMAKRINKKNHHKYYDDDPIGNETW
jgi:antitoxin MazE